jgi:excisionase family DNA binding protein
MKPDSSSLSSHSLDQLMTVFEVAIYLKVADTTVRKWCSKGLLPFVRVGSRDIRVKARDLAAFVADGQAQPLTSASQHSSGWGRSKGLEYPLLLNS